MMNIKEVNTLIRNRRSIYPSEFVQGKDIPQTVIESLLENANWAPTHRMTEPWRFKIFRKKSLERLSDYLATYYQKNTPSEKASVMKLKKIKQKPLQSSCVIAICMEPSPQQVVPIEEEIAAVAMAVQNIWLSCSAYGIGTYWSSPKSMYEADEFLALGPRERCLGLLYLGYYEGAQKLGKRQSISKKVVWM